MRKIKTQNSTSGKDYDLMDEGEFENFQEAIKAVNTVLVDSSSVPEDIQKILADPCVDQVLSRKIQNTKFWLLVHALKLFLKRYSSGLPVRGSIPDMIADTQNYVQLQKIYSAKSREDIDLMSSCLSSIYEASDRSFDLITEDEVRLFSRNSHCLRLIRTSPIFIEYRAGTDSSSLSNLKSLINSSNAGGELNIEIIFYLMVRAVSRFHTIHNRFPGFYADQIESDILILKSCLKDILNDLGCSNISKDDYVHEICRYGGSELHSVSAFIGGCCAQEVIKLITKQFVPLRGTMIYNALSSTTVTYDW